MPGIISRFFAHQLNTDKIQRPTPGNGYLECIAQEEKCSVIFNPIREITESGIVTEDGKQHNIDVLICATGFDVSFRPQYPLCGRNGVDVREVWKDAPETYLSVTAPQFPNYFSESSRPFLLQYSIPTDTPSHQWPIWPLWARLDPAYHRDHHTLCGEMHLQDADRRYQVLHAKAGSS